MSRRDELRIERFLSALNFDGIRPDGQGMFKLSRQASANAVRNVEYVCAKDERFDWKWKDEA